MVPVVLTGDYVYFQNGGLLYRYDRALPPERQNPAGRALPGRLEGALGPNAAVLSDGGNVTIAVRDPGGNYVQHRYDLSKQMPKPTFTFNGHTFTQGGVMMFASDSRVGYGKAIAGAPGSLLAITNAGNVFVADQQTCSEPAAVALLQGSDAIAVCSGALIRVTVDERH